MAEGTATVYLLFKTSKIIFLIEKSKHYYTTLTFFQTLLTVNQHQQKVEDISLLLINSVR